MGLSARTPTIAVMVLFMVVTFYLPHFSLRAVTVTGLDGLWSRDAE